MKRRTRLAIATLALLMTFPLGGCVSLLEITQAHADRSRVYLGTRADWALIRESMGRSWIFPLFILDLPLSFALDTLLLPFTLGYELIRPDPKMPEEKPQ